MEVLPFTTDLQAFKSFVGSVRATGGGDAAEDVFSGIEAAQALAWEAGSRILVHVADAPCHGCEFHDMVRFAFCHQAYMLSTCDSSVKSAEWELLDSDRSRTVMCVAGASCLSCLSCNFHNLPGRSLGTRLTSLVEMLCTLIRPSACSGSRQQKPRAHRRQILPGW